MRAPSWATSERYLISFSAWQRYCGADPNIIGRPLVIGGITRVVVGVMPKEFFFPEPAVQLWVPIQPGRRALAPGQMSFLGVGRLASSRTLESARAEVAASVRSPRSPGDSGLRPTLGLFPLTQVVVADYRTAVWALVGASVSLLLIVIANVGTILLVRVDARRNELAIRAALGAGPARLCRQLMTEQLTLACAAGALGLVVAKLCVTLAQHVRLFEGSRISSVTFGWHTSAVLLAIAFIVFPAATVMPWRRTRAVNPSDALKTGGPNVSGGSRTALRALILFELTVTPPLLLAASLFFAHFLRAVQTDWGFLPLHASMIELQLPESLERRLAPQVDLIERAMGSVASLPNVEAVGMGYSVPIRIGAYRRGVRVVAEGRAVDPDVDIAEFRVSRGYFKALGTSIIRGREFTEGDVRSAEKVTSD